MVLPEGEDVQFRAGGYMQIEAPPYSLSFKEFDIEKDAEARKAYEALGGGGIPFIEVNGTLIRGYDPDAIMAALK